MNNRTASTNPILNPDDPGHCDICGRAIFEISNATSSHHAWGWGWIVCPYCLPASAGLVEIAIRIARIQKAINRFLDRLAGWP